MPSPIQGPQFQAQTRTQPWQALPVTYPASTQAAPPAASGVLTTVSDDFNRADSSSLGNTSVGNVRWTNLIGVNGISSNRAANISYSADGLASRAISYIDMGSADGTIEATLHVSGTTGHFTPCIAFRIQDDKHFWLLGAAGLEIVSFSGGALQFTSVISPGYVDGDVAKVVLSGSTITAYKNGSVIGTGPITDSTYVNATKHGIYFEDEGAGITQSLDDWSYGYTPAPISARSRGWVVGAIGWGVSDTTTGKYGISSNTAVKIGSGSLAVFLSVPSQTNDITVDTSGLANSAQYITIYCLADANGYLGVQVHSGTLYVVTDYAGIGPTFGTSYSYGSAFPATLRATYDPTTGVCNAYLAGTLRSTLTLDATRQAAWTAPYLVGISNDDAANAITFDNLSVNGTIADSFNRPDADHLGFTDTGQEWTG